MSSSSNIPSPLTALRAFLNASKLSPPPDTDQNTSHQGPRGFIIIPLWQQTESLNDQSPQWPLLLQLISALEPTMNSNANLLRNVRPDIYDRAMQLYKCQAGAPPSNSLPQPSKCFKNLRISLNLAPRDSIPDIGEGRAYTMISCFGRGHNGGVSAMLQMMGRMRFVPDIPNLRAPLARLSVKPYAEEWIMVEMFCSALDGEDMIMGGVGGEGEAQMGVGEGVGLDLEGMTIAESNTQQEGYAMFGTVDGFGEPWEKYFPDDRQMCSQKRGGEWWYPTGARGEEEDGRREGGEGEENVVGEEDKEQKDGQIPNQEKEAKQADSREEIGDHDQFNPSD